MGYEIYYERAFIKVNDKYIPIACEGSNNTWTTNWMGRDIPEKNWQVLNWRNRSKLLYTEDEVRKIAADYEQLNQNSCLNFKTRNRPFGIGEFERWILCGLKSAHTIEEYHQYGNSMEILDYSGEYGTWTTYPFSSTEKFLELIDMLKERPMLNVRFPYSRTIYRPKQQRNSPKNYSSNDLYYVLCKDQNQYFCNLTKRGYCYTTEISNPAIRTFRGEKDAQSYIRKYPEKLAQMSVKVIEKGDD